MRGTVVLDLATNAVLTRNGRRLKPLRRADRRPPLTSGDSLQSGARPRSAGVLCTAFGFRAVVLLLAGLRSVGPHRPRRKGAGGLLPGSFWVRAHALEALNWKLDAARGFPWASNAD